MATQRRGSRFILAFKAFARVLASGQVADRVYAALEEQPPQLPPAITTEPPKPTLHPLQLLMLLQREGRLVDFLMEDLQGLPDAQIGAAVREVHQKCRQVLAQQVPLEAVLSEAEDATTTVPAGYDPSAVRVVGNLGARPPFTGAVRHRGWRAREVKLQALPAGQDPRIIAPAEVEVP